MTTRLDSWNDTASRKAIEDFVTRVTTTGSPDFVEPAARIAVFDNDGTLWCEKPMPVELGFILQRLSAMAIEDPSLRDKQPWKFDYTAGAEKSLQLARTRGWTVVSMRNDWKTVFAATS